MPMVIQRTDTVAVSDSTICLDEQCHFIAFSQAVIGIGMAVSPSALQSYYVRP